MTYIKKQQITFIHGWLFGSFIWKNIQKYFNDIEHCNFITLCGYSTNNAKCDDYEIINNSLKLQNDNDILLAYSYSASLILSSKNLESCKGNIFLINPFFKIKKNSIDKLILEIQDDTDTCIKKFIYESTKGDGYHKKNYANLYKLFKDNFIPSKDSLCSGLTNLKNINSKPLLIKNTKKLHIIQTTADQITDLDYLFNFEKQGANTYRLEKLTHYPFFDFDKIYDIIKDKI